MQYILHIQYIVLIRIYNHDHMSTSIMVNMVKMAPPTGNGLGLDYQLVLMKRITTD